MPALCTKRLGCAPVDVDLEARRVGRASPRRLQFETAATWVARAAAFDRMAGRLERAGRTAQARQAAAQRDDAAAAAWSGSGEHGDSWASDNPGAGRAAGR